MDAFFVFVALGVSRGRESIQLDLLLKFMLELGPFLENVY